MAVSQYDPKGEIKQPLHHIAESVGMASDVRLGWAKEALAAGYDVNRLYQDSAFTRPHMNYPTRPLDMALDMPGRKDDDGEYISLKLIRLFLDHGADPRLMDYHDIASPVDRARELVCNQNEDDQRFGAEALKMLLDKAQELEDREAEARGGQSDDRWRKEREEVERWQKVPTGAWDGVKSYLGYGSDAHPESPLPGTPSETTKRRLEESKARYQEAYKKDREARGKA